MRIFLANVGANASHRFAGPVFENGTFEFLPIPETPDLHSRRATRYRDLRSWYYPERDLLDYVPRRLWDVSCHNDPEFETFTYGDNCDSNSRAAGLKLMGSGDVLLFLVRLERWSGGKRTGHYGFYLVARIEVAPIDWRLAAVAARPSDREMRVFGRNAHLIRGMSRSGLWDGFWVFRGCGGSRRFRRAVPVTRGLCESVFRAADGSPWRWDGGRSDLQVIGSYTRACRCVLDTSDPEQAARADILWNWIDEHSA